MSTNVHPTDRKPEATVGDCWLQRPLNLLSEAPPARAAVLMPQQVIDGFGFSAVLAYAALHSGMDDQQIAEELSICKGYMSRFLRGVAESWAKRLVRFCRVTHNLGPLQWMAAQLGCDLVQRDTRAAEVAELKARLRALEQAA